VQGGCREKAIDHRKGMSATEGGTCRTRGLQRPNCGGAPRRYGCEPTARANHPTHTGLAVDSVSGLYDSLPRTPGIRSRHCDPPAVCLRPPLRRPLRSNWKGSAAGNRISTPAYICLSRVPTQSRTLRMCGKAHNLPAAVSQEIRSHLLRLATSVVPTGLSRVVIAFPALKRRAIGIRPSRDSCCLLHRMPRYRHFSQQLPNGSY
jgi:hypothetical protein